MPPRSQTRPPHLPYVVSAFGACEKIRRLNAELAEHAEKSPKHFFSAASAASALNVICSQTLKADITYRLALPAHLPSQASHQLPTSRIERFRGPRSPGPRRLPRQARSRA